MPKLLRVSQATHAGSGEGGGGGGGGGVGGGGGGGGGGVGGVGGGGGGVGGVGGGGGGAGDEDGGSFGSPGVLAVGDGYHPRLLRDAEGGNRPHAPHAAASDCRPKGIPNCGPTQTELLGDLRYVREPIGYAGTPQS